MRRDLVLVLLLAAAAFGIRTYPAWNNVFTEAGVNFLETDAWYHVRLTENQVRNYPWRVTVDPFAAPGGQFVPIAPLFDTLTSTIVVALHGRDANTPEVERVAALMPPIYGALIVIVVWALARRVFDRRAGLLAAALVTVLPGHFMDRTMLGFVDHHALEALLAISVLLLFARGLGSEAASGMRPVANDGLAGAALGLYLLAWGSGAFLVAIIGAWLLAYALLARSSTELMQGARLTAVAAAVALLLVLTFQHPGMHRYGSQLLGLAGLGVTAAVIAFVTARAPSFPPRSTILAGVVAVSMAAAVVVFVFARDLVTQVSIDVARIAPDPTRMGVLEARPLFLYGGQWNWAQPWIFFRTGFFIGLIALIPFAVRVWRRRAGVDLLLLFFAVAMFVATIGQNRFGYYLVTACAVLGGWLATEVLDWAGVPHAGNPTPVPRTRLPLAREIAVVAVAGGMFAPNLSPRVLLAERNASYPAYWRDAMHWLREQTPIPFAKHGPGYYLARYGAGDHTPDYAVMSWWDQGYWITQQARRVPVANPTQERAPNAARFYSATDEAAALEILRAERSRFVVSDFELPFRRLADGTIMGRFQTIVDWTGADHSRYYEVVYRRDPSGWSPVWIFREPYYQSMAFRLSVLGGMGTSPNNTTAIVTLANRVDTNGTRFREILAQRTYPTHDAAVAALAASGPDAEIVGLDPWQSAIPLPPVRGLVPVHDVRTPEQKAGEAPWVRIFERR